MDAFEIGVLIAIAAAVLACCLAARAGGRRVSDDYGHHQHARHLAAAEAARRDEEDLRDMLAITNARRRARGLPERSVADAIREFGGD